MDHQLDGAPHGSPPRCGAITRSGNPCKRFPLRGATRCTKHGAGAPQVRRKAAERLELQMIEQQLARLGVPVEEADPIAALADALRHAHGDLLAARALVAEADPAYDTKRIKLYSDALDRLTRIAVAASQTRLAERQAQLTHEQVERLHAAVERAIQPLPLEHQQRVVMRLGAELRREAGEEPEA